MYVVLDAFCGVDPGSYGKVDFLDGVVVFKEGDRLYIEAPGQSRTALQ